MCHYLTSNRQFSLLAAPLPLSAVPPPQSAESSRLWVFYYCELPKYFYISTELFSGTNLFSVYWHGHGGQGDSKPSQVRLWKRDKWGCWGRSYSSYTQNVCYNWLYKWYNQTRWHHKTYVSHFLKKKKFSTWIFESLSNHNVRCDKNGLYYYPKNKLLRVLLHSICNIFKHCVCLSIAQRIEALLLWPIIYSSLSRKVHIRLVTVEYKFLSDKTFIVLIWFLKS